MSIAAIGLNLTLGYAGQVSLAQAAFVGHRRLYGGAVDDAGLAADRALLVLSGCSASLSAGCSAIPALRVQHHYLAFVTLAFSTLVYLVSRNEQWLTGGISGIADIPRPSMFGISTVASLFTTSSSPSWSSCRR